MSYVERLLEQRATIWEQAKGLLDTAAAEKRELSTDEEASYGKMTSDLEALRKQADRLAEDAKSAEAAEAALRQLAGQREERRNDDSAESEAEKGLRQLANREIRSYTVMPTKAEVRDLSKGTSTAGGVTVPTTFYGTMWQHLRESATLIGAGATVLNTDSGEDITIPTTTAFGSASIVAEGAAIPEDDPAFVGRTLGAYKYGQLIQVSNELLEDTGFDLVGFLARTLGDNIGVALGSDLISGTGTNEPRGIITDATLGVTGGTGVAGVPTFDNLIDLYYSVIAPYRNKSTAGWVLRDSSAASIRKIKDTTGAYIWQPSLVAGTPDTLLGKPVYTDPNVAATGTTAKAAVFGDLSAYFVRVVNGVRFERSDDYAFNTDQVTFRALLRADGMLVDRTGAVKYYAGGAS